MTDEDEQAIRVGMMSNLTTAKGLSEFLTLISEAKRLGIPICGVLAGPIPHKADRAAIDKAIAESDGLLTYRGPVYSEAKAKFFNEIDVFIFPSHSESYGLVIIEALSYGVPVITSARGCIPSYLVHPAGCAVPPDIFVKAALTIIAGWLLEPETYRHASDAALELTQKLVLESKVDLLNLVENIVGEEKVVEQ